MTASRSTPSLHDRLCDAIGQCDEIEKALAAADKLADDLYPGLDSRSNDYFDSLKHALDISMHRQDLALMHAFLSGRLSRLEDGSARDNPHLPAPKRFLGHRAAFLASAWSEGFKTDQEAENDAAKKPPYPFCRHPEKCRSGRCEADRCCND